MPATMSLKLATKAWAAARSAHALHLVLVPGADHYLVAGLADTQADDAAAEQWAAVCAALRAFVESRRPCIGALSLSSEYGWTSPPSSESSSSESDSAMVAPTPVTAAAVAREPVATPPAPSRPPPQDEDH